ncbi:MAG: spore protease YyaC, partial [Firmicutes bacterium]|nr:spore protease YyaC [Bacillota bacterium]
MSFFPSIKRNSAAPTKIHVEDADATNKFVRAFSGQLLKQLASPDRARVIVCIGTDRSTGD